MSNLRNSVQLIGRLGKDPDVRTLNKGKRVATMTLATNETYTNQKGEKVQDTQWHNLVVWGKLVNIVSSYLTKGMEIAIEGKLVHRSYETNGEKKYITEITVNDLVMLGSKNKN